MPKKESNDRLFWGTSEEHPRKTVKKQETIEIDRIPIIYLLVEVAYFSI
jgi:hypothetical protein